MLDILKYKTRCVKFVIFSFYKKHKKKEVFDIFKNLNLEHLKKKSISFGAAFLLTALLPTATVIIRGMSEESDISNKNQKIKIYDSSSGKEIEISLEELLIGAWPAEIPLNWYSKAAEAVKAQIIAIFSYFLYQNGINSSLDLNYKKDSCIKHFAYYSLEKRKELWGDKFEEYEKIAKKAVGEVKDLVLCYDNKPALAMFFSCCYRETTPCSVGFSQDLPYLQSVESKECDFMNLERGFAISKSELAEILKERFANEEFSKYFGTLKEKYSVEEFSKKLDGTKPEDWFKILETNDTGYVLKMKFLDCEIIGHNFRHIVGTMKIRSANFTINFDPETEKFNFKSLGFGHGVGMSQWGAKFMAEQGYTYDKILLHYYPGTEIKKI